MHLVNRVLSAFQMKLPETALGSLFSLLLRRMQIRLRGIRFRERSENQIAAETLVRVDTCKSIASGLALLDHIRGGDFSTRYVLMALATGERRRVIRSLAMEAC